MSKSPHSQRYAAGETGRRVALRPLFRSLKARGWSAETAPNQCVRAVRRGAHPCDRVRMRRSALHCGDFWPEAAIVTGHGAGVGGVPGPPGILAANQAFSGAAVPAPPQDRLMRAPLIERECILDIFCFLFVNNFYFRLLPGVPSSSALGPEALAIEPAPV